MRNQLAQLRSDHSMSQEELADKVGVSRQTIISIEKGRYNPTLPLAFKIADLFNIVDLREIFHESESDGSHLDGNTADRNA